jgi:hypothetical protein
MPKTLFCGEDMGKIVSAVFLGGLVSLFGSTVFGADDSPAQKPALEQPSQKPPSAVPDTRTVAAEEPLWKQINGLFRGNLVADGVSGNEIRIRATAGRVWTISVPYGNVPACRSEFPLRPDPQSDGRIFISRGEGVVQGCERVITLIEVSPNYLKGEMKGIFGVTNFNFFLKKVSE